MIARLGKEIQHEDSIYYWAWKNGIPVYSPALTDGSIGDMIYFHTYKNPGLVLDLVADIRAMNDEAIKAAPRKTGMLILGGGKYILSCYRQYSCILTVSVQAIRKSIFVSEYSFAWVG